jgi:hypothetical protein
MATFGGSSLKSQSGVILEELLNRHTYSALSSYNNQAIITIALRVILFFLRGEIFQPFGVN